MKNTNVTHETITDVMNLIETDRYGLKKTLLEWNAQYVAESDFEEWLEPKIIYAAQQIQFDGEQADAPAIVEALRLNANAGLPWLKDHAAIVDGMDGVYSAITNTYVEKGNTVACVWLICTADALEGAVKVIKTAMESNGFSVEEEESSKEFYRDVGEVETTVVGTRKFGKEVE